MKIINVIEMISGVLSNIKTFPIDHDGFYGEDNADFFSEEVAVKRAEELFKKMATENGMDEEDLDEYLDDGSYNNHNGYEVLLVWSDPEINE